MAQQSKPNILIIDNDEGVVQAIATRLNSVGYMCINAQTGAQGLDAFNAGPIDLVITDLNMPVLDGASLIKRIRAFSNVPVIIVTGYRKAYRETVDQFTNIAVLEKPFPSEVLVELVEVELASNENNAAA